MNWFNGLSLQWKIILVIVILLVIFYLYRRYSSSIKNLFQPRDINKEQIVLANGEVITVGSAADLPQSQKNVLEKLAGDLKSDIYGLNITHNMALYISASSLSDAEVDYLAGYYKRNLTNGVSLYEDMNNEAYSCFVQDCTGVKNLLVKLEKTGNR